MSLNRESILEVFKPSQRLTVWEAKQLITAELFEFEHELVRAMKVNDKRDPAFVPQVMDEAVDIFGNARYLGLSLFCEAVLYIKKHTPRRYAMLQDAYNLMLRGLNKYNPKDATAMANYLYAFIDASDSIKLILEVNKVSTPEGS